MAENTATAVYTATATDADGDPLEFSLSGTDAALFEIDPATGIVTLNAVPDFEVPGDAGEGGSVAGDNVYDIVITASDGTNPGEDIIACIAGEVIRHAICTSLGDRKRVFRPRRTTIDDIGLSGIETAIIAGRYADNQIIKAIAIHISCRRN
ncbi:cadherin repeat domain-containing protein [Yoonia sp. R2-816]|uniref:cadherin repeat domain-containing protein n=1 Tax=Yoonia sp. R2-816 TaxID=3342638 RepID=UPI003727C769